MKKENYHLRLNDLIPIVGLDSYKTRNSIVTNNLNIEIYKKAIGRLNFLRMYNALGIVSIATGLVALVKS